MRTKRYVVQGIAALILGCAASGVAAQDQPKIPVCIGSSYYKLPIQTGLHFDGRAIGYTNNPKLKPKDYSWAEGDPALQLGGFTYSSANGAGRDNQMPVFDFLLGRKSKFAVSVLRVFPKSRRPNPYRANFTTPDELIGSSVLYLKGISSPEQFIPLELTLFDNPVYFKCTKGLPVVGTDPDKMSCTLRGNLPDSSRVYASFRVGYDYAGQWPQENTSRDGWRAALSVTCSPEESGVLS